MAIALRPDIVSLQEKAARFAQKFIASRSDLQLADCFPWDIWKEMGKQGLLGMGLPAKYGGLGGDYLSLSVTGEALVRSGHNMGIALSWLMHSMVSRFLILGFGNKRHHDTYLKRLASGDITASFAVSEPSRGASPKHLETSADRHGDCYVLTGEKSYMTNGPIADLFIVVAVTSLDKGQKRFTAFIVPKDAAGLTVTEPMKLDFLRPAPHGGIILRDCSLPVSNVLGRDGCAYDDIVKPFAEVEDALAMGPAMGAMERELELVLDSLRERKVDVAEELKQDIGELQALGDTLRLMAYEAAIMLDRAAQNPEIPSLLISFGKLSGRYQDLLEILVEKSGVEKNAELLSLARELAVGASMSDRRTLARQRKLGEARLVGRESHEVSI